MDMRTKTILINIGIVTGLAYSYFFNGSSLYIVIGTGIFFVVFANVLLFFVSRKKKQKQPESM